MKLFLSWSGNRSREVAELFNDWLPNVIQAVEPWISTSDIEKGKRWGLEVLTQLEEAKFGLICLTSENLDSPWILFEAGALSKTLDKTHVCPYLLDIDFVDIDGPLAQFQGTKANKEDTQKLVRTINKALETNPIEQSRLDKLFDKWWPDLEAGLAKISAQTDVAKKARRGDREILEELLLLVRSFAYTNEQIVSKIQQAFPHLTQQELSKLISALVEWNADGLSKGNQPATLTRNPDGTISVRVLSLSDVNDNPNNLSEMPKQKPSNR